MSLLTILLVGCGKTGENQQLSLENEYSSENSNIRSTENVIIYDEKILEEEVLDDTKAESIEDNISTNDSVEVYNTWEDAYRDIIHNMDSHLVDPYDLRSEPDNIIFIGIHDFDSDSIPELVIGDLVSIAIFTYENNNAKKITDLFELESWGALNGVIIIDNMLFIEKAGSDGCGYAGFTYHEGEYITGMYDDYSSETAYINGKEVSGEEFRQLFNITEFYVHEGRHKNIILPGNNWFQCIMREDENKGTIIINKEEVEIDNLDFSILQY